MSNVTESNEETLKMAIIKQSPISVGMNFVFGYDLNNKSY